MRKFFIFSACGMFLAASLHASGYRIPENSIASLAKAGANFADTNGADSAYYNPANMVFLPNKSYIEFLTTYINLPPIRYVDSQDERKNSSSKQEHFITPSLHYVSPFVSENIRFGLSFTIPGGLTKRWYDPFGKTYAEKFALQIFELFPSMAYRVNDKFSLGFGPRAVYIKGVVKSDGNIKVPTGKEANPLMDAQISRTMTGDSVDFGYALFANIRPNEKTNIALAYKSKVDMSVSGDATLNSKTPIPALNTSFNTGGSITIPLPAVLDIAFSYTFAQKTTLEFVYERTFWSSYEKLDFQYSKAITNPLLKGAFDNPEKNIRDWKDSNAFRLGVSYKMNDKLSLMAGIALDETPANKKYTSFELPDSDAMLYSFGLTYKIRPDTALGFAYLFDKKKKFSVDESFKGTFKKTQAHLVGLSISYEY